MLLYVSPSELFLISKCLQKYDSEKISFILMLKLTRHMASQHTNLTSVVRCMPLYDCNHENALNPELYTVLVCFKVVVLIEFG